MKRQNGFARVRAACGQIAQLVWWFCRAEQRVRRFVGTTLNEAIENAKRGWKGQGDG